MTTQTEFDSWLGDEQDYLFTILSQISEIEGIDERDRSSNVFNVDQCLTESAFQCA